MARCRTNMLPADSRPTLAEVATMLEDAVRGLDFMRDHVSPSFTGAALLLRWVGEDRETASGLWEMLAKRGLCR